MNHLAKYAKAYVALVGVVTQIINLNYFNGTTQHNLVVILGVLTTLGVVFTPNSITTTDG